LSPSALSRSRFKSRRLRQCRQTGEGVKAASKILSNYFIALNDLASFGTSKAGDDAKDLLTKASTEAKLGAAPQKALSSVAGFLTRAAMSGYQQKLLADDVVKVHEESSLLRPALARPLAWSISSSCETRS